jgi:hypothetical protein
MRLFSILWVDILLSFLPAKVQSCGHLCAGQAQANALCVRHRGLSIAQPSGITLRVVR